MSFSKYPKNYHAHGYGWHNMAAMGYSKVDPSISSGSSGVSSLYPSATQPANLGMKYPQFLTNFQRIIKHVILIFF